jgi:hypothetical protein
MSPWGIFPIGRRLGEVWGGYTPHTLIKDKIKKFLENF